MATAPVALRTRPRWVSRVSTAAAGLTGRLISPHRAALSNLVSIPLTTFGLACIDTGVFYANGVAGWIVTGLSLIVLEHLIADE